MAEIKLLDCTLRDGGFINDWEFGNNTIISIFERLSSAKIDIIEVGFIDERRAFDKNRTIVPNTHSFKLIFENCKSNSMVVGMIDFGTCSLDRIEKCSESFLDGIRVIFKKKDMHAAVDYCAQLKAKGYAVFVQPVSITSYSEEELEQLVMIVNELEPYAISIVDTYGLLHKDNLLSYYKLINNKLNRKIGIGYHSHNNFQLAYANIIELIENIEDRDLVIDSSVYGMGKSAGNANTELTANYMNTRFGRDYDITHILEIIDTDILRIYRTSPWGYSLNYFLAAKHDCHPSYVNYLVEKKTLSVEAISQLLEEIPLDHKLTFDKKLIKDAYINYQEFGIDDHETIEMLKSIIQGKDILIMGPGNTLNTEKFIIQDYIKKNEPVIISANCFIEEYQPDFMFLSNSKRYSQLIGKISHAQKKENCPKVIATTNITAIDGQVDYWLNYSSLLGEVNSDIRDSALIMIMQLLIKMKIEKVSLVGFDGFSHENNYFDLFYDFSNSNTKAEAVNNDIIVALNVFRDDISIDFVTKSKYSEEL